MSLHTSNFMAPSPGSCKDFLGKNLKCTEETKYLKVNFLFFYILHVLSK